MWSHVVGLYDFTLLLEYCPYGAMDSLLEVCAWAMMTHSPWHCVSTKATHSLTCTPRRL